MTSNQQNLLELAKQGNSRAITALINRSLQPKGITVKVNLNGSCLQILVESDRVLDQKSITQFLVRGIKQLNISSIDSVKIFGKQSGKDLLDWRQDIPLQEKLKESETQKSTLGGDSAISGKTQVSDISRREKSTLRTTEQDIGERSKQDIWAKSKEVTFSALKSAWKWYLSGFKSRPDLPLYFSPRLYRILLTFFVFIWVTTPLGFYNETSSSSSNNSSSRSSSSSRSQDLKLLCSQDDKGNPKHIIQVDNTRFEITKLSTDFYQVLGVEDIRSGFDANFAYNIGRRDEINYYGGYPRLAPDDMDELEEVEAWFEAVGRTCTNK